MTSIIKTPSAWMPVVLSLIVFAVMFIYIATAGVPAREADEGTGAHLFQIWLVLEVFMIAFFTIKWLPRAPKPALLVLALQIFATLMAMAPVFFLGL